MTGGILSHPQILKTVISDFLLLSCFVPSWKSQAFFFWAYDTDVQILEQK